MSEQTAKVFRVPASTKIILNIAVSPCWVAGIYEVTHFQGLHHSLEKGGGVALALAVYINLLLWSYRLTVTSDTVAYRQLMKAEFVARIDQIVFAGSMSSDPRVQGSGPVTISTKDGRSVTIPRLFDQEAADLLRQLGPGKENDPA